MDTIKVRFEQYGNVYEVNRDNWPHNDWFDFDELAEEQVPLSAQAQKARDERLAFLNEKEYVSGEELSSDEEEERNRLMQDNVYNMRGEEYAEYMTTATDTYGTVFVGRWSSRCSNLVAMYFATGMCELSDMRTLEDAEAAAIHEFCKWRGDLPVPLFMATFSAYRRVMMLEGTAEGDKEKRYNKAIQQYKLEKLRDKTITMHDILGQSGLSHVARGGDIDAVVRAVLPKFKEMIRSGLIDLEPPTTQTPVKCSLAYHPHKVVFKVTKTGPNEYTVIVGIEPEKSVFVVVEPFRALFNDNVPDKLVSKLTLVDSHEEVGTFPPCEWMKKIGFLYGTEGSVTMFTEVSREERNAIHERLGGQIDKYRRDVILMPTPDICGVLLLATLDQRPGKRTRDSPGGEGGGAARSRRAPGPAGELDSDDALHIAKAQLQETNPDLTEEEAIRLAVAFLAPASSFSDL